MHIEPVSTEVLLPRDTVCTVSMQPYIRFANPPSEPFKWAADAVGTQLNAITKTLDLAQRGCQDRPASFTLFPEYSIPGVVGARLIDARISSDSWHKNSVVVAGIDGLLCSEYADLLTSLQVESTPDGLPAGIGDRWVNCCLIWSKGNDGVVRRWVQPKLSRSRREMNTQILDMFEGDSVFLFKAQYLDDLFPSYFMVLVCFDWIADGINGSIRNEVLDKLNEMFKLQDKSLPLHWVFVVQHNEEPNHPFFLYGTLELLTGTNHGFVERNHCAVVQANSATHGGSDKKRRYGFTACTFPPGLLVDCSGCRPSVCMEPVRLRGSNALANCRDVVFREMRECIHSYLIRVPKYIRRTVTDRTYPIKQAEVHPVCDGTDDPRLGGKPIPAVLKWVHDSLDSLDAGKALTDCTLEEISGQSRKTVISDTRTLDSDTLSSRMRQALPSHVGSDEANKTHEGVDHWANDEMNALEHIVNSVSLAGIAYDRVNVKASLLHAAVHHGSSPIQLVAIRGKNHRACAQHYQDFIAPRVPNDPVLVISRDDNNYVLNRLECDKFYEAGNRGNRWFVDYSRLVTCARKASNPEQFRREIDELIIGERRIV